MLIRKVKKEDASQVYDLYKSVSKAYPGHLTQYEDELTVEYIKNEVIDKALKYGLMLVIEHNAKIAGSLKAYTYPYRCLAHTLTNATMMIHPDYQNKKYGTALMQEFLNMLKNEYQHIFRFELLPHVSNQKAIKFYERNGFTIEARLQKKIMNIYGQMEEEIILSWFNPNFNKKKLDDYYTYLKTIL